MFLGLRTVIYRVRDPPPRRSGYANASHAALLDQPFHVGFEIGGYELGLQPAGADLVVGTNVRIYRGVDNIEAAHAYMLAHGALPHEAIQDVGEGIKVAVTDPFGNVVGLIENPHFTAITEGESDPPSPRLRRLAPPTCASNLLTAEVRCVVRAARALVGRNLRVGAERTRPDRRALSTREAGIESGALASTHCSSAVSMSKVDVPVPPPQCHAGHHEQPVVVRDATRAVHRLDDAVVASGWRSWRDLRIVPRQYEINLPPRSRTASGWCRARS